MSTVIDLSGVEAGSTATERKFMKPGIQTLVISTIELVQSKSNSQGLKVTFDSVENESKFSETFWLAQKALSRLQYLIKLFTGEKHEGQLTIPELEAKLIGKSEVVIVDGREALSAPVTQEDGTIKTYVNTYPKLRFADFGVKDILNESDKQPRIDKLAEEVQPNKGDLPSSTTSSSDFPF